MARDSLISFLLKIVVFLNQIFLFCCTAFPGYQVRGLERNDTCFSYDASGWAASRIRAGQSIYTKCGDTYLLGGYSVLGTSSTQNGDSFSITYSGLSSHTMVYFSFTMWAIDTWNQNVDYFIVEVGSTSFTGWKNFDKTNFPANYCGMSDDDLRDIKIFGKVAHTGPSITFKLISKFDQDSTNEAFAMRDFTMLFASPSPLPANYMCGTASIAIDPTIQCSCGAGLYLDASNTCAACDPKCDSCFGPGPDNCYACKQGYSFDGTSCIACDSLCTSCFGPTSSECGGCQSGYLLYQNTTCIPASNCVSPMVVTGCDTYCDSPCSDPNDFIYWNSSCLSSCPSPLNQNTVSSLFKLCIFPCAFGEYLYWDGTCSTACSYPLIQRNEAGKLYCDFPCSLSEILYWNRTCSTSCNVPLVSSSAHGVNFCSYPCNSGEFLYQNGSCLTNCLAPFKPRSEAGKGYCSPICSNNFELLSNGACAPSCKFPLYFSSNSSGTYCNLPCKKASEYYHDTGVCTGKCNTSYIYQDGLYLRCLPPIEPVALVKLLHHIRYLEISFPYQLRNMTVTKQMNILSMIILPSVVEKAKKDLLEGISLSKVGLYNLPCGFLVNFLEELILIGIILGAGVVFVILELAAKNAGWAHLQVMFERLKVLAKWNVVIVLITINGGDIVFFTSIEFRTFNPTSITVNLSLVLSIIMLLCAIITLLGGLYLIYKIQDFKVKAEKSPTAEGYSDYLNSWEPFQIFFLAFKDAKILSHSFYFIYGLRLAAPMMVATFLSTVPILQSVFYVIISISIIVFVSHNRPIKDLVDLINLIALEVFILIAHVCVLILTIFDFKDIEISDAQRIFADIIIIMNYCIYYLAAGFLPIKILIGIRRAASFQRIRSNEESAAWFQILFLPLQQGGLGFEQIQLVTPVTIAKLKTMSAKTYNMPAKKFIPHSLPKLRNAQVASEKSQQSFSIDVEQEKKLNISNVNNITNITNVTNVLQITQTEMFPTPRLKKRKQNHFQTEDDMKKVEEDDNKDEDNLVNRLNNLTNKKLDVSRIIIHSPRIENLQFPRNFDISSSLNLSQLSPFNVNTDNSYIRSPRELQ